MPEPLDVFISYAHEDRTLKNKLTKHLSNLQRQGFIRTWHDGDVIAGTAWEQQITNHLNSAHLILLLISANFMASDFCYTIEMQQAMARHHAKQAQVIPVLLSATDWQDTPFSDLQMLPTDARPVNQWPRLDDALTNVVEGIRKAIKGLSSSRMNSLGALSTTETSRAQILYWNVPYRRNPYFTGQETILSDLYRTLNADKSVALTQPQAISGLGGIGKTQIALRP